MASDMAIDRAPTFKERVKQERELEILQAARDVFSDVGYDRASIDDIAERVGIGKGTVYLHFANKEAILVAIMRHGVRGLVDRIHGQVVARDSAQDKLRAVLEALVEHRYANESLVRMVSSEIPHFLANKERAEAIGELRELIASLIRQGQEQGELNAKPEAYFTALAMLSLVFACDKQGDPMPKQKLLESANQLYFHGISKEAS